MTFLLEQKPYDVFLSKYTRAHFLATFDSLNTKKEFVDVVSVEDFLPRKKRATRYRHTTIVDLNNDSDASLDVFPVNNSNIVSEI